LLFDGFVEHVHTTDVSCSQSSHRAGSDHASWERRVVEERDSRCSSKKSHEMS
jgi:hypothetical protein